MADDSTTTPYSTTTKFVEASMPTWLNEYDSARLAAYKLYDDLYRNDPSEYKLILRGSEEMPIYLPTARRIVNVMSRYVGRDLGFSIENVESDDAAKEIAVVVGDLFKRERVVSQFNAAKKQCIKMGDGCLWISANMDKPEGQRIKILAIDPGTYFPIEDENDVDTVVGCDIIERILGKDDKVFIKRQRYLKHSHPDHQNFGNPEAPVQYECVKLEEQDWEDPLKQKVIEVLTPPMLLEAGITQLPVYHFKYNEDVGNPFGTSVLQGLERIILGLNQTATDEDVAVAMAGLGMYHADSTPVDDDGNETSWILGPNRVVETPKDGVFERISGISSLDPSQKHIQFLLDNMDTTLGISDVALGQVDTQLAESGVALAIRLGPLLDSADEQNVNLLGVLTQFFFDLKSWLKAYEGIDLGEASLIPSFSSAVPRNKKEESDRLQDLFVNGIISKLFYRQELEKLYGYRFPADIDDQILREQAEANPYYDPNGDQTDQTDSTGDIPEEV